MRETTFAITNWKSVLDAKCIEHCLRQMHGVHNADANFMRGQVTVHHDESMVSVADMKKMLNESGFVCMQSMTKHLVSEVDPSATTAISRGAHMEHPGHTIIMPIVPAKGKAAEQAGH